MVINSSVRGAFLNIAKLFAEICDLAGSNFSTNNQSKQQRLKRVNGFMNIRASCKATNRIENPGTYVINLTNDYVIIVQC